MTLLLKQWENLDLRETRQIIYQSKGIDESYPKMHFLLNLSYYVKSCGHVCQFWHFFTIPAHQIWSYYVTQEANFEIFLFCPNSTFNIRKRHQISSGKALYFRSYQPKTRGKHPPPVLLGLSMGIARIKLVKMVSKQGGTEQCLGFTL